MRSVSNDAIDIIEHALGTRYAVKAEIQPSHLLIDTIDEDHAASFARAVGIEDNPVPEEIIYSTSGSGLVSYFNDSGVLKYMKEGSSTEVTVAGVGTVIGKPSVCAQSLCLLLSDGSIHLYDVDYGAVDSLSTNILSGDTLIDTLSGTTASISLVSETKIVVFEDDHGGFRVSLYLYTSQWDRISQAHRFMFPVKENHTRIQRSYAGMLVSSTAVELGTKVYAYISNALTCTVDAVAWDSQTGVWGDIFTAVPTDADLTQCEFRLTNSYVRDSTVYLIGQFHRFDAADSQSVYCMVLSSTNGQNFSIGKFAVVATAGYRFLGAVSDRDLYIASCNRIGKKAFTHVFSPITGAEGYTLSVPERSCIMFQDSNAQQASLVIGVGNAEYIYDEKMIRHGRVKVYTGLELASGTEWHLHGTYIIRKISRAVREGERTLVLSLLNESMWNLSGYTSPYYTEINSKSSGYDDLHDFSGFYVAGSSGFGEQGFSIDIWGGHRWSGSGGDLSTGGGTPYDTKGHAAGVTAMWRTEDLSEALGCDGYPLVVGQVHVRLYGWSYNDSGGSLNDTVNVTVATIAPDGTKSYFYSSGSARFPNYYPANHTAAGDYPIEYDLDIPNGHRIEYLVWEFYSSVATKYCMHRIDVSSGVIVSYKPEFGEEWEQMEAGGYKVPGKLSPYIMYSRTPYAAWNFVIAASFSNGVAIPSITNLSNYPIASGLVGLGSDGANYIVVRYNKSMTRFELVSVRNRIETIVTTAVPTDTVVNPFDILLRHIDGDFELFLKVNGEWKLQLSYSWLDTDGFMVTDHITSLKVGIYGLVRVPYFRITGYDPTEYDFNGDGETVKNCCGFAMLPGPADFSDFPYTGSVEIDDATYSYDERQTMAWDDVRGPTQLRQYGKYDPPYGNGSWGIECRDFRWGWPAHQWAGWICALDDGSAYETNAMDWDVWITTNGKVVNLPGRARYYGVNEIIGKVSHNTNNRVYLTGALMGLLRVKGLSDYHGHGTLCKFATSGEIQCHWFYGSSGDSDVTVRDLIDHVARSAGAHAIFPGDTVITSHASPVSVGTLSYADGIDVAFRVDDLSTGSIATNVNAIAIDGDSSLSLQITSGSSLSASLISVPSNTVIETYAFAAGTSQHLFRVVFHDNFVSLYADGCWACTFHLETITYSTALSLELTSSIGRTFYDITMDELSDWRESVFIDLYTDGQSAISSIIQERPVEMTCHSDGSICFWYDPDRPEIINDSLIIRNHNWDEDESASGASDAILYYSSTSTIQNTDYLKEYGFTTRVFSLPNLRTGAIRAAKILIQRSLEAARIHNFETRLDQRVEQGDILRGSYLDPGTTHTNEIDVIVESVNISISEGKSSMSISGREARS